MSVISESDAEQLREIFAEEMHSEVTILLFIKRGDSASEDARKLLEEVCSLSGKIKLRVYDFEKAQEVQKYGIARAPAVTLLGEGDYKIRYYGVPFEQEFETLIEWLIMVSKGSAEIRESTKRELAELSEEKKLTVLVTYACPQCPPVAQLAMQFAIASEKVSVDVIDIFEFPEVKKEFPVLISTPKIFVGSRTLTGSRGGDEASLLELIKEVKE
jgi:thioredoxin reductase (NADPH)